MAKYLVDVNLPYYFSLWNSNEYIHQKDINDEASDEEIWAYAKENQLTIISKDSDFSNKIMYRTPPPKVIHIRFGNMKMKDFFAKMTSIWPDILKLSEHCKLVSVYNDRIEGVE
jgi:predicted nuclease of predicted toxin-antitoxin system